MDTLWRELLELVYNYLTLPNDSFRFSLANKAIRSALPSDISTLHKWKNSSHKSLNEISRHGHHIHDIIMYNIKAQMSIRKYLTITSIYQLDPEPYDDCDNNLYVYTYKHRDMMHRAAIIDSGTRRYTIDYEGFHDAYGSLDDYR